MDATLALDRHRPAGDGEQVGELGVVDDQGRNVAPQLLQRLAEGFHGPGAGRSCTRGTLNIAAPCDRYRGACAPAGLPEPSPGVAV